MQVSGVAAAVMEVVLEFIYTDLLPRVPEAFLSEDGAAELFDAADRYLIFPMKVRIFMGFCAINSIHISAQNHFERNPLPLRRLKMESTASQVGGLLGRPCP